MKARLRLRLRLAALTAALTAALAALSASSASAQSDRAAGLFTEARQLPVLHRAAVVRVVGGEVELDVVQVFANPGDRVGQADFRVHLPTGASVRGFGFWRGDRYLASTLREKAEAEARHTAAANAGRASGLSTSDGTISRFSVHPVAARSTQRVRVTLSLPTVTELGRSHLALPLDAILGGGAAASTLDVRIEAESEVAEWGVDGARPVPIERRGARVRFAATLDGPNAEVWWRQVRPAVEVGASAVALPEGDRGIVLTAFMSNEVYGDDVRTTHLIVDASFSMRRQLERVERVVRRVGPSAELHAVAESAMMPASPEGLREAIQAGWAGHVLDPFVLRSTLRQLGCDGPGHCLVLTDAEGAAASLHGVEVAGLALADPEALAHLEGKLASAVRVHRVGVDPDAALDGLVDELVRPRLRVVSARSISGAPIDLLGSSRGVAAGGVLRIPARMDQAEALEVELDLAGQLVTHRVAPDWLEPDGARAGAVRRAVYRATLARWMRRYRDERDDRRRAEIVALSLREGIPTPFTARQVDDPELSLASIKGGDPHATTPDRPDLRAATVVYPFGEIRRMVRDPARREWVDRFLAPRGWDERSYRVDVHRAFMDGTTDRRSAWYLIDDRDPQVNLQVEEDRLEVRVAVPSQVSTVRILAPGGEPIVLAPLDEVWRIPLDTLPRGSLILEVRDRAGNRSAVSVTRVGRSMISALPAGAPPEPRGPVPASPPAAHLHLVGRGSGPLPTRLRGSELVVRVADGQELRFDPSTVELGSLEATSHLGLGGQGHLLGFGDGTLLRLDCGDSPICSARPVPGITPGHPVRGLARVRGRVFAAVLGVGLQELTEIGLRPARVRLSTRYTSALAVHRGRLYVGTLYDGLWRVVNGRPIQTRFGPRHVDRLVTADGRLEVWSVTGRYRWIGTDRFRRLGDTQLASRQDDLTSLVRHQGRVFAGGFDRGLLVRGPDGRLDPAGVELRGGVRGHHVNALASWGDALWVGTEAGLQVVRGGRARRVHPASVHDLAVGPSALAAATSGGLLLVDADGTARRVDPPNAGARSAFSAVGWLRGTLYAGTLDGLQRLDGDRLVPVGPADGFDGGWVTALHPHEGELYVGTYASGVWRLRPSGRAEAVPGLESSWVPFHGLRPIAGGLWVGGLGMPPRWRGPSGRLSSWRLPVRDASDVLELEPGRYLVASSAGAIEVSVPAKTELAVGSAELPGQARVVGPVRVEPAGRSVGRVPVVVEDEGEPVRKGGAGGKG